MVAGAFKFIVREFPVFGDFTTEIDMYTSVYFNIDWHFWLCNYVYELFEPKSHHKSCMMNLSTFSVQP